MNKHPLLYEFLKVDHSILDSKKGIKNFSKKLLAILADLNKMNSFMTDNKMMQNGVYRISDF